MAMSDTILPQFVDVTTLTPAKTFVCEVHGQRKFVVRFNGDNTRIHCIDCFEESLPRTVRSLT